MCIVTSSIKSPGFGFGAEIAMCVRFVPSKIQIFGWWYPTRICSIPAAGSTIRTFFLWLGVFWVGTGCHFLPKPERWPPSFRRLELIGFACAFVHLFCLRAVIFMQSSANMWSLPDCLIIFNVQLGCLKIRVCFWCHGNGTTDRFGIPSFLWTGWFV